MTGMIVLAILAAVVVCSEIDYRRQRAARHKPFVDRLRKAMEGDR